MIWASRDANAKGYTFNYEALKAGNEDVQMRSDWTFPLCTGEERLKGGDGKKLHPTQKPEALLARVILAASRPDDLVLDPFYGTGTTGAVAKKLGRRFIGIEREKKYAQGRGKAHRRRAGRAIAVDRALRHRARGAARAVLGADRARAGDARRACSPTPRSATRRSCAPTARCRSATRVGSIHRIGALAQGLEACNGWTFWHVETPKGLHAHRRIARADARRDGGSGGVVRFSAFGGKSLRTRQLQRRAWRRHPCSPAGRRCRFPA